jgi:hypothetical protein
VPGRSLLKLYKNHVAKAPRITLPASSASNDLGGQILRQIIVPYGHFKLSANCLKGLGHRLYVFGFK